MNSFIANSPLKRTIRHNYKTNEQKNDIFGAGIKKNCDKDGKLKHIEVSAPQLCIFPPIRKIANCLSLCRVAEAIVEISDRKGANTFG